MHATFFTVLTLRIKLPILLSYLMPPGMVYDKLPGLCPLRQGCKIHSWVRSTHWVDSITPSGTVIMRRCSAEQTYTLASTDIIHIRKAQWSDRGTEHERGETYPSSGLKYKGRRLPWYCETLVTTCKITRRRNRKDHNRHLHSHEKIKFNLSGKETIW
jgi:hypothetical protein